MGLGRFMGSTEEKEPNWVDANGLAFYFVLGCLAQSVEQLTLNQRVEGSSPSASTIIKEKLMNKLIIVIFVLCLSYEAHCKIDFKSIEECAEYYDI